MTAAKARTTRTKTGQHEWLTIPEMCAELKIARSTLYNWRAIGEGPRFHKIGGALRVRRDTFDAWVASREEPLDEAI